MDKNIEMIVAMDEKGVIGKAGGMPWGRVTADLKRFKALTVGKSIIMGRKTFESIGGKPLPQRQNIVITGRQNWLPEGVTVVHGPEEALAQSLHQPIIIGGAEIYKLFLPNTSVLYVTEIAGKWDGDTHFPVKTLAEFKEIDRETIEPDEKNPHRLVFVTYKRLA